MNETDASFLQLLGAGGFGAVIGWYVYYVNGYRRANKERRVEVFAPAPR